MKQTAIGFIGGGNMARSMIAGMVASDFNPQKIWVCDRNQEKQDYFRQQYGVQTCGSQDVIVEKCNVIILAVKPQSLGDVADAIGAKIRKARPLLISICAGIDMAQLERWFGEQVAIVRVMPNTPSLLQCGASGMYANDKLADQQRNLTEHVMRASGVAVWVKDESKMDVVGALSGSGPAYFFLLMEMMINTAIDLGLEPKQAKLLATQTAYGASRMALESSEDVEVLRKRVTSKGGITEAALNSLEQANIRSIMSEAMKQNVARGQELAKLFDRTPQITANTEE